MNSIGIITDTHSSIPQEEAKELGITILPMPFMVDGEVRLEGGNLSREEFFEKQRAGAALSTSQPVPADVMKLWDEQLRRYDTLLHFPISSGISGTCETAQALADQKPYRDRVFVVDNGRVATPQYRAILDAIELMKKGFTAKEIKEILEKNGDKMNILIAVDTLEYLRKGGRISAAASVVGTALNIKPVLYLSTGKLVEFKKCHGMKAARRMMLASTKESVAGRLTEGYSEDEIYMMASGSADEETMASWVAEIKEAFPGKEVLSVPLSLGVCCHTGEGTLGVGYSCKPR